MGKTCRLLLALISLCILGTSSSFAQIEDVTLDDGTVIKVDRSKFPDLSFIRQGQLPTPHAARRKAQAHKAPAKLPDHVNNGIDKYFPPIVNQDGGSCGSAQNIYYMFTHEINAVRDADASDPVNQYPTHFTWLLTYQNSDKEVMARTNGIPNVVTYGGKTYSRLFGNQTHEDNDYGWMQGYDKWYSAMWNRAASTCGFSAPANTPEGRQEIKEWLYNHCGDETIHSGGICGIGVAAYGTWGKIPTTVTNASAGVAGMSYVQSWGDTYNHALTICGYDDRIEFDLDGDGIVGEADEEEVGAWIIANSWGDGWENKGFIYCPYKYSYAVGKDQGAWNPGSYIIRRDYRPLRTIKLLMDYTRRSEILLGAGVAQNLDATAPESSISFEHFKYAGDASGANPAPEIPMLGRWVDGLHHEPMEFGYDLTDLTATVDRTRPLKYFFFVKTKNTAIGTGHIYKASIINYEIDPEGVEIPFDSENVTIENRGKETVITVIVPGEQIYPPYNLALAGTTLSWTAPEHSGLQLKGYNIYCGSELVDFVTTTSYTPSQMEDSPYTVSAVYTSGKYDIESTRTNAVSAAVPATGDNQVLILDQCGFTVPNAVPQELSEATIEFWMRSDLNRSYVDQVGPGWGTFLFHTDNSGQLYAGWNTSSGDRMIVSGAFVVSKWTHVAITIKGNKMTAFVNGAQRAAITSKNYSGLAGFGDLKFGHSGENQFWKAGLDEVRVWKKALTSKEIKASMKSPIALPSMQKDLLVYLPMETIEEGGKTKLRELARGNHATMHSAGSWSTSVLKSLLTGTTEHTAAIVGVEPSYVATQPFTIGASSSVDAVDWVWKAEGARTTDLRGMQPTLVYDQPGTYTVTLTVTYTDGTTTVTEQSLTVVAGQAPVADFIAPAYTLPAGDRFSLVNRTQGEGCSYVWSTPGAEVETSTGTNASVLYPQLGTFAVTLTATNAFGTSSVTKELSVTPAAPVSRFELEPADVLLGQPVKLIDKSRYEPQQWEWEISNGHRAFTVQGQQPTVVPVAPGYYDVTLTTANSEGSNTYTQKQVLIVSNADAKTALQFTGFERIEWGSPITGSTAGLTLDWWMRPTALGTTILTTTDDQLSATCDADGQMTFVLGGKSAVSGSGYILTNEWHHYAIVLDKGLVSYYRDGILFAAPTTKVATVCPALTGNLIWGSANQGFAGMVDEFRIWASAMDRDQIRHYCNAPITDIASAQINDQLLLYYDFNQNGGDVIDRAGAHNARRINFGPDGDAWNSALGVFTLDLGAEPAGDLTAQYLTNYERPFLTATGTVNGNNSGRFLKLAMRTARSTWQDAGAIVKGGITTGAHVDTDHNRDITVETEWSGFATPLHDYRLWQTVTLPAGRYTFSCKFGDGSDAQGSRLVVARGATMVSEADCEAQAIAWNVLSEGTVSFSLPVTTEVSLGIIVNLDGKASFGIRSFALEGIPVEPIQAEADLTSDYCYLTINPEAHTQKALYMHDANTLAWHDFQPADPTQVWQRTEGGYINLATQTTLTTSQLAFQLANYGGTGESGLAQLAAGEANVSEHAITQADLTAARVSAALQQATQALGESCATGTVIESGVTYTAPTADADASALITLAAPADRVALTTTAAALHDRPSRVTLYGSNDGSRWTAIRTIDALANALPFSPDYTDGTAQQTATWSSGYLPLGERYRQLKLEVNNINYAAGGQAALVQGRHQFQLADIQLATPVLQGDYQAQASELLAVIDDASARQRAGVAGDYDIQRLTHAALVFHSYSSAAYAALQQAVAEVTADANNYASVNYQPATTAPYFAALQQAQDALSGRDRTDAQYTALEQQLRDTYAHIAAAQLLADGLYYIDNAIQQAFPKGVYAFDDQHVAWNNVDRQNPNFVWQVRLAQSDRDGCHYVITNYATGRHLDHAGTKSMALTSETEVQQTISCMQDDIFAIIDPTGLNYHPDYFDKGNGVGGRLVGIKPSGLATDPAAWRFVPLTSQDVAALATQPAASQVDQRYPLILNEEQLSTNSPGVSTLKLRNLIDGATPYYQTYSTIYSSTVFPTVEKPYIQVELPEPVSRFWLCTQAYSVSSTAMRPMRIRISASADGEQWQDITTLRNIDNAYPRESGDFADKTNLWQSPLIDMQQPYRYVRMIVEEVNYRMHSGNNNLYTSFALGEMQLYCPDELVGISGPQSDIAPADVYTLDGRKISGNQLRQGLYIRDGRVVRVK